MGLNMVFEDMHGVGQPFPYRLHNDATEGVTIDIVNGQIMAMSNLPKADTFECEAFMTGFKYYSYQEVQAGGYSIAWWIFKMPAPLGFVEAIFHASLSEPNDIRLFLDGGNNMLSMYLIDNQMQMLPRMRYDLNPRCIDRFKSTIEGQMSKPVSDKPHYYRTVERVQSNYGTKEMFQRGNRFRHYDKRTGMILIG